MAMSPTQLRAAIPNMCSSDVLQISKDDIVKALRTTDSHKTIDDTVSLRQLLFLEKKTQSGDDRFYYYDHEDSTLRCLKRIEMSASDPKKIECAIANTILLESDVEKKLTLEERVTYGYQTFELCRIQWPTPPDAVCRDMFMSQPPVKEISFCIGGSQHFQYTVKKDDGVRFRDIISKFESVAEADDRLEFLEIDLMGFFQSTRKELTQIDQQGYVQCDEYGRLQS